MGDSIVFQVLPADSFNADIWEVLKSRDLIADNPGQSLIGECFDFCFVEMKDVAVVDDGANRAVDDGVKFEWQPP